MSIRFAILGAGRIGQVHARAVAGNDNAILAAVYDPVAAAASSISDQYGAEVRTVEEIAVAGDIDAVVLCTPTDLHAEQIELFQCWRILRTARECTLMMLALAQTPQMLQLTTRSASLWS